MTANNFIREFAIKIFSEAARTEDELYYKVLNQDNDFTVKKLQDDYMLAWFLGEFCSCLNILQPYEQEIIKNDTDSFQCVYLIEGKYVLETVIYSSDYCDILDWRFVEKKTKIVEVTEWVEV